MELAPRRKASFKVVTPTSVADSDENYVIMESFNQVYSFIKVTTVAQLN